MDHARKGMVFFGRRQFFQRRKMTGKVLLAWSGGKDSAMALHELQMGGRDVAALLTTLTGDYGRVSMHGVREDLLERQADALGIPLWKVFISRTSSNDEYESRMMAVLAGCRGQGIGAVAFGDIFLEDLRRYREKNLARASLGALFPLWGMDTSGLASRFVSLGFRAVVTCVDSHVLDGSFAGRRFDEEFISDLPPGVDPCGENGEFHSFVCGGPPFAAEVPVTRGEVVLREGRFHFCDFLPGTAG
jgi:uncharacterized protein (TIGR00290 family)